MLSRLSILLLITNLYSFSTFDLIGKELIIENYHFRLGTNVSNLNCENTLSCVSNILSQKGGYYCDTNMLLLKWDDVFLCWSNFEMNFNIGTAIIENKKVKVEMK
jgi:hypothetical protein